MQRHFHAVRVAGHTTEWFCQRAGTADWRRLFPLIIYLNHPSWWDPLTCLLLSRALFPHVGHYAPIDAKALASYGILRRLGFFAVEAKTARGAAAFLRSSQAILAGPTAALWITPHGRFIDPRERSIPLQPGLAHLIKRLRSGTVLPLALEYPFWQERTPEALAHFGEPIAIAEQEDLSVSAWSQLLRRRLIQTQEMLAEHAAAQNAAAFETLVGGATGVGGIYDFYRRGRARLSGKAFNPGHSA